MANAAFDLAVVIDPTQQKLLNRKIKTLSTRSDLRGILSLSKDMIAIGVTIHLSLSSNSIAVYLIAIWVIGAFQFAMSECLVHEAAHWNLFKTRKLNDLCEIFMCLPFFQTIGAYRADHRMHHVRLLKDEDPLSVEYRAIGLGRPSPNMFWIWFVKPFTGFGATMIARGVPDRSGRSDWLKIGLFWALATTAAVHYGIVAQVVAYWIVPMFLCNGAFLYWSEISDHYNTRTGYRTRSGVVANFLFHNNGYHHVHHRYPSVTQFNYKRAHILTRREGDDVSRNFLETYRQIRNG